MNKHRKTDRPRRYPDERRKEWVAFANVHGIAAAARKFGISKFAVRCHLLAAGHTPKRTGSPRIYDDAFVARVAEHRARSGSDKRTAKAFGISHSTVSRFYKNFPGETLLAA